MGRNIFRSAIQLIRNDDARENLRHRSAEAADYNTNHSRLYGLAPELLATLNDHLPLASGLILRLTCSKFYRSSVFNHTRRCATRADRFEAVCMLECDGVVKGYCCKGCVKKHRYTEFSNEELAKRAHTRHCLATMKCFRVGFFRELSFIELKRRYREQVPWGPPFNVFHDYNDQCNFVSRAGRIYFYMHDRCINVKFGICNTSLLSLYGHFASLCRSLNLPFCPHITMGNEEVIKLFYEDSCHKHQCKRCKTTIYVNTGGPVTYIFVRRHFGKLSSPKDPTWLAHTYASKDPHLESYCEAINDWQGGQQPLSLEQLQLQQREKMRMPDFDNLFTKVTLPRRRWGIRGGVRSG